MFEKAIVSGFLLLVLLGSASGCHEANMASQAGHSARIRTTIGLELRFIPAGDFVMGSPDGPANERPVHEVRILEPFYMGSTEVTQEQFAVFVAETGYVTTAEKNGGAKVWRDGTWVMDSKAHFRNVFPGPNRPVVAVSFYDAQAFCQWLTRKERIAGTISSAAEIRLPTEAEWEYAARAGTQSIYSGTSRPAELCAYANVPDRSAAHAGLGRDVIACDDGVALETAEVAHYRPNAFGLYDMSGNVWEWTSDRLGAYSSEQATDPRGSEKGDEFVMRGGSWSGNLHGLHVSHRDGYAPDLRGGAIGFRVVLR